MKREQNKIIYFVFEEATHYKTSMIDNSGKKDKK